MEDQTVSDKVSHQTAPPPICETVLGFLERDIRQADIGIYGKRAAELQENFFRKHERRADTLVILLFCIDGAWREIPPNANQYTQ
jgi:hypothetical protein